MAAMEDDHEETNIDVEYCGFEGHLLDSIE
jgi:hypothetical protein